jgi:hypothetical protein
LAANQTAVKGRVRQVDRFDCGMLSQATSTRSRPKPAKVLSEGLAAAKALFSFRSKLTLPEGEGPASSSTHPEDKQRLAG